MLDPSIVVPLAAAAFGAGFIDAIGGGGGLVQLPALFALVNGVPPATLLGTNKFSAMVGTAGAAWKYSRENPVPWRIVAPAAMAALLASAAGALLVSQVPNELLRYAVPFVLLALLVYTVTNPALGMDHDVDKPDAERARIAAAGCGGVGFYDGLFGPGAGSFYKLVYTRGAGFDFLRAAAPSKIANVGSNVGALAVFAWGGFVLWPLAVWMMVFNVAGGQLGARVGIRYGNRWIRIAFIVMVSLLVAKTFHDSYAVYFELLFTTSN